MSCRTITSPITGKEETSQTWNDIRAFVQTEEEADKLYKQLSSPAFTSWFGDWVNNPGGQRVSKVVNEIGEPLLVYHGTSEEFNVFDMTSSGLTFFAESKAYAEVYARKKAENIQLLKSILKQSTEVFDALDAEKGYPWLYASIEAMAKEGYSADKITNLVLNNLDLAKNFEPDYERGYVQDSGDEYADDPSYIDPNVDYEGISNKNIEAVVTEVLGKIYASDKTLNILNDLENDVSSNEADLVRFAAKQGVETIMPGFLNIRNPQLANDISSESINEGTLKLDNTSDGLIGTDAMYYHRVGGKKEMIENEKVYAIKDANQVKSVFNVGTFGVDKGGYNNTKTGFVPVERGPGYIERIQEKTKELEKKGARVLGIQDGIRYSYDPNNVYFQQGEITSSKASPATVARIKDFLKRIGVDIKMMDNITVNGVKKDANGAALIMQQLVQVVYGKEDVALTEEAMHFAVEIIEQRDPKLFNQLLKEVNSYNLYDQVVKNYGKLADYQTADGKPDIRKLKKEAIAKILTETVINKNEGLTEKPELLAKAEGWWETFLTALKNIFQKSGFDLAAIKVLSGEFEGTAQELRAEEGAVYLQATEGMSKQDTTIQRILDMAKRLSLNTATEKYELDGSEIPYRVTQLVGDTYEDLFKNSALTKSEWQQVVESVSMSTGDAGHKDIQWMMENVFLSADRTLLPKDQEGDDTNYVSRLEPNDRRLYDTLKENLRERLASFGPGAKFLVETTIYNGTNTAGTVDLIVITPAGKVSMLDWKFTKINTTYNKDIPWYKIGAWKEQMGYYKSMLQSQYGIDPKDFVQTRMIPILTTYSEGDAKLNIKPTVTDVRIGSVDVKLIDEAYLLPVGVEDEDTGNKKVNALLVKLNGIYKSLSEKKAISPLDKANKAEELNYLYSAIRQLQMRENVKPLLEQAKILNKNIQNIIKEYNDSWKGIDLSTVDEAAKDEFSNNIMLYEASLQTYTSLTTELKSLFNGEKTPEQKELWEDIRDTTEDANELASELRDISDEFAQDIVAASYDVLNFLKPEKIIKGFSKWFSSTSTLQLKGTELLFKMANKAFGLASMDTTTEGNRLLELKKNFDEWASKKGLTSKNYFDILKKKDKNELIDEFDPKFYTELKQKIAAKDFDWIVANIDVPQFRKDIAEALDKEYARIESKVRVGSKEDNENAILRERSNAFDLYNLTTTTSPGWRIYDIVKKNPLRSKWQSEEWTELTKPENAPAKAFYDYIRERNEYYQSIGYIVNERTFLPFVRKGLLEKIVMGGDLKIGEGLLRNITISEGDVGYGKTDPLTKEPIYKIPKYFTRDTGEEVSDDLFKNMTLLNEMAIRFAYLDKIENQMRLIVNTENNKEAIKTSYFGKTKYKANGEVETVDDNSENAKLISDMMEAIVYGHKFVENENFDQLLGGLGKFGKNLNQKLGMDIFPENFDDAQISLNKSLTQLNTAFQLKTLGLNPLSSIATLLGGSFQSLINAGTYFTKTDYVANEAMISMAKFNGEDGKKLMAALEYFLPLTENYNVEIAKKLSMNKFSQESIQEFLMSLMRNADQHVQTVNFFSYLNNTIVENGQLVNAREFLRASDKYANIYNVGSQERRKLQDEFDKDVKALVKEKGVMNLAEVKNNELVIPGIERKSDTVIKLRRIVQNVTKDALGNLSADDVRKINLNIYGKSFMVFKNWIPRLVDIRLGNLKYNSATEAYEWGRSRMMFRMLSKEFLRSTDSLLSALGGNDEKFIAQIKDLYNAKKAEYEKDTGKVLEMTEAQFIDLVRQNIQSQMTDFLFYASLTALIIGAKAMVPDDDEDDASKNRYKYMLRIIDKVRDEVAYFYDPTAIISLTSGGVFPAITYLETFKKAFTNLGKEMFAIGIGDKEGQDDNYVIKYFLKAAPIASQLDAFILLFYPDLAKELGMRAQSEARPIGR
jgi:hypothetical protein